MIDTKEIPLENAFHVSVGSNRNSASAFKSFLGTKQSGTDFIGFDSGLRWHRCHTHRSWKEQRRQHDVQSF